MFEYYYNNLPNVLINSFTQIHQYEPHVIPRHVPLQGVIFYTKDLDYGIKYFEKEMLLRIFFSIGFKK